MSLEYIKITQIEVPVTKLREVQNSSPDYQDLLISIQEHGVLQPILLRPGKEAGDYILVDGLQRFSCAKECGYETIAANINEKLTNDNEALLISVIANLQKVATKPFEYANALRLYIRKNQDITIPDLAIKLGKNSAWILDRLSLTNLTEEIGRRVDSGEISLKKGQGLALLPPEDQEEVLASAGGMKANDLYDLCLEQKRSKDHLTPTRKGRTQPAKFSGAPVLRKRADIIAESQILEGYRKVNEAMGEMQPKEAWQNAIKWALQMDFLSMRDRQAAYEARQETIKEASKKLDSGKEKE